MAAGVLVQLSTSEESSDEQDSKDDTISITSSASCSGMSKSTPLSERGDMDSSSSTSASTSAADTSKRTAHSLLSVLQQAKLSDLSRKRVIRNNLPPKGKKRKATSAVERVFSILTNAFSTQQDNSLQDYIEASLMLQYNYK